MEIYNIPLALTDDRAFLTAYLLEQRPEIALSGRRPAIVICPGGGFMTLSVRETEPLAIAFAAQGFQTFVLHYHTAQTGNAGWPQPMLDLALALRTIREHAEEWNTAPSQVAILGASAGGNVCANLAVHWQGPMVTDALGGSPELYRPDAVILAYSLIDLSAQQESLSRDPAVDIPHPVYHNTLRDFHTQMEQTLQGNTSHADGKNPCDPARWVTDAVPPVFLWHTSMDEMVYVGNSLSFCQELHRQRVPFELHVFEEGPHGLALSTKATAGKPEDIVPDNEVWLPLALRFLRRHKFVF